VCAWCKAKQENSGARVAKSGHGFGPVGLITVRGAFDPSDLLAPSNQPLTAGASLEVGVKVLERCRVHVWIHT
jgi:hypothetical protein